MKNQSHQSPLCPPSYYAAAQTVNKEENNVALQGSPLKTKLWSDSEHPSENTVISVLVVLPGDVAHEGWTGPEPRHITASALEIIL